MRAPNEIDGSRRTSAEKGIDVKFRRENRGQKKTDTRQFRSLSSLSGPANAIPLFPN